MKERSDSDTERERQLEEAYAEIMANPPPLAADPWLNEWLNWKLAQPRNKSSEIS